MVYFGEHGKMGFIGIFIAALLFTLVIGRVLELPYSSVDELLSGYKGGKIISLGVQLFLLVLYSAMLSASGEVLNTIFGIKPFIASILTALLTTAVTIKGYEAVSAASRFLFVPMLVIIFIISITTAEKTTAFPPPSLVTPKAVLSPFIYVSYNMLTAVPLLISIPDKYMYKSCGRQVGIVLFIIMAMLMLPLYTHYSDLEGRALPLMMLLDSSSNIIKYMYQLLLGAAVFSTAVSAAYSCTLTDFKAKIPPVIKIGAINISALLLSVIGFESIVERVYFLFGILGFLLMFIVFTDNRAG